MKKLLLTSFSILTAVFVFILSSGIHIYGKETFSNTYALQPGHCSNPDCSDASCLTDEEEAENAEEDDEEGSDDEEKDGASLNNNAESMSETISATGLYVGQIDSNTIEVIIEGKPMVFFFSEDAKKTFNARLFKKDTKVTIQYYLNDKGQNILVIIK